MRCERRNEHSDSFQRLFIDAAFFLGDLDKFVVVLHESGDDRIQAEALQTGRDVVYHSVAELDHLFCRLDILLFAVLEQVPETFQEAVDAVDAAVIPLGIQLRRSHEELVHSQGVAAVVAHQVIRGDHISLGLAHLDAVLAGNHSLVEQLVERLVKVDHADVTEEFCIESGVEQMQHRMLHTADIHIYRQHLVRLLAGYQFFVIVVVHIAQEIPG